VTGAKLDLAEIEIELKHGDRSDPSGSGTRRPRSDRCETGTEDSEIRNHSAIAEVIRRH
jgi:hypothetical protein